MHQTKGIPGSCKYTLATFSCKEEPHDANIQANCKKCFCQKKRMSKISWSPGTWVINSVRNVGISLAKNVRFFLLKLDIWQTCRHWGVTKGLNCEWSVNGGLSDFLDEALKILLTKGGNILQIKCLSLTEYLEAVRLAECRVGLWKH